MKYIKSAFPHTIPVLASYFFTAVAFGLLMDHNGFAPVWAIAMGVFIYAGSGQFVAVGIMAAGFNPAAMLGMTVLVNARYAFYGLSCIEMFRGFGRLKPYMIYALTDETYTLLNSVTTPGYLDKKRFMFTVAFLNNAYWITGCAAGALFGEVFSFDTRGIDFIMTAFFIVILADKLKHGDTNKPALWGLIISAVCRVVFGADLFALSAMVCLLVLFLFGRRKFDKRSGEDV